MNQKKRAILACKVNDLIFGGIVKNFKTFKTEKDIERYIRKILRKHGMSNSYPPIVANNTSVIHAKPRDKKLARGFLVLDIGAKYRGMCSDMTRTLFIGNANRREKALYNLVKDCQSKCIKKLKIGISCKELHEYSIRLLGKYAKYFPHALGHGIGSKVHRKPRISYKSNEVVKEGIIAIEPGIYIKNKREDFGIRIEDTICIGNNIEILTKFPKKLIEV